MKSAIAQSLTSRGIKGDFKFTDVRSLRLFVEGLQKLQAYERLAIRETLAVAESKLTECVVQYPRDVLPQFYLGIVKIANGYDGAPEAVRLFESLAKEVKELRAAAMYNLASAYIELYTDESLGKAEEVLRSVIHELGDSKSVEDVSLRFQARILLLFQAIRQQLWVKRQHPVDTLGTEIKQTVPKLQAELNGFLKGFSEEERLPDAIRADIMADFYNDQGLLYEFQASTAPNQNEKIVLARKAADAFSQALRNKPNWIPAKSNLARVYMDELKDLDSAIRCWGEVQQIRPGDDYSEYMLGRLYEMKGDLTCAEEHYKNARRILRAKKKLARIYEAIQRRSEAIHVWQEILEEHPSDEEALEAKVRLGFEVTPASSGEPTA